MSDKQERVMWYAISAAIIMLLFPPYYNHFAEFPASYPDAGPLRVYGWFLSKPIRTDGVDVALRMAQLGILGGLSVGYILSLGKREREEAQSLRGMSNQNPDRPDNIAVP